MKTLTPYIMFPGTCKEAMTFYRDCLDGELVLLDTFGDSPIEVPAEFQSRIFNSILQAGDFRLMASDDLPTHATTRGSNFALFVNFSDNAERLTVFDKLAQGGQVTMPIQDGGLGMLVDQFGIQWMLVHE